MFALSSSWGFCIYPRPIREIKICLSFTTCKIIINFFSFSYFWIFLTTEFEMETIKKVIEMDWNKDMESSCYRVRVDFRWIDLIFMTVMERYETISWGEKKHQLVIVFSRQLGVWKERNAVPYRDYISTLIWWCGNRYNSIATILCGAAVAAIIFVSFGNLYARYTPDKGPKLPFWAPY